MTNSSLQSDDSISRKTSRRRVRPLRQDESRRRLWAKRSLAILVGILFLIGIEFALRLADWPIVVERNDPLIGFQSSTPLFSPDESGEWMTTAKNRQQFFRSDRFLADKGNDEFRVFCLGGSTVQGRPYQIETSFTTWLELSLAAADPNVDWQVVNCGGVSYASYRLVPILDEVLRYEPDLIVLCTGHNEFLEDRTYASVVNRPRWQLESHRWARHSNLYRAIRAGWMRLIGTDESRLQRELLAGEVQARLDYEGGLELFVRDDPWARAVVGHYEMNLRRMINKCQQVGVPVVVMNPVENLRDCGPFKSVFSSDVPEATRKSIQQTLEDSPSQIESDSNAVLLKLQEMATADPRYALTHYLIGRCHDELGDSEQARLAYQKARDEDICPLRMTGELHAALFRVVEAEGVPMIDVAQLISAQSRDGIPDRTWLLDHVHPSIEGHQLIANALHEWMIKKGWGRNDGAWRERRDQAFKTHRESLGFAYFEHGRMRLEGLRKWTRGEAFGALPAEDKISPQIENANGLQGDAPER